MFARVRITTGVPEKVDDGIRHFRETVVSGYKNVAGFKGAYLLVNRQNGRIMGITLWDTEADMRATTACVRTAASRRHASRERHHTHSGGIRSGRRTISKA
jgi:heme-degrading monooxygenase HmoA